MTKSEIQSILGAKTVSFNALFAKATGSVTAAVFLSQAVFWQEKAKFKNALETMDFDGEAYFSKTAAEWYEETGLSTEQQKTARKPLVASGILKEKRAGLPAKMYFRIDIDALVSGISAYLNMGITVSGFSANRKPENPRTLNGKFRKQEAGKPASNNKGRELKESLESDREAKNSLPTTETEITLEAEKPLSPVPPPPFPHIAVHDPEFPGTTIIAPMPVTEPPVQRINLSDRARATTPVELEAALRSFYMDWPNEWSVGVLENGRGIAYSVERRAEIVKDFCCWAVDNGRGMDTFQALNAKLQGWFRNERFSTWKQKAQPGTNTPQALQNIRQL